MMNYGKVEIQSNIKDMMMATCMGGTGKSRLLGKNIMESENLGFEQLEDKIFEYGSQIKGREYEDRSIFVCLVSMLRRMEKQMACVG